MRYKD